jgi:hypothetical protein
LIPHQGHWKNRFFNHLGGGSVVKTWDQEVCSLYGLGFKPCGCSYNDHWRLTWLLTSGPVGLVEERASWSESIYLWIKLFFKVFKKYIKNILKIYFLITTHQNPYHHTKSISNAPSLPPKNP